MLAKINRNKKAREKRKMEKEAKKTVSVSVDREIWRKIKAFAVLEELSVAQMVEKALEDEIKIMEGKNA